MEAARRQRASITCVQEHWAKQKHGMVMLLSLSLAHWLDKPHNFLSRCLESVTFPDKGLEIDAVIAVVDGISEPAHVVGEISSPKEGLSILQGRSIDLFPAEEELGHRQVAAYVLGILHLVRKVNADCSKFVY